MNKQKNQYGKRILGNVRIPVGFEYSNEYSNRPFREGSIPNYLHGSRL
jgi:hypothetical protein